MPGLDVARLLRIVVQRRAQLGDGAGQHARGDVAMPPHLVEQLVASQQFARSAQQRQQHRERLGLQRLRFAIAQQGMGGRVDHDAIELEARIQAVVAGGGWSGPGLHRHFLMIAS